MAPFYLTKISPDDFAEIVPLLFKAFSEKSVQMRFLGPDTPEQHQWNIDHFRADLEKNPNDIWLKVVDKTNERIVAACLWGICLEGPFPKPYEPRERPWLAVDKDLEKREMELMALVGAKRQTFYTMPLLKLHILAVDPDYNRRGAGGLMMRWGCSLADQLFLPAVVEATEQGSQLYSAHGFTKRDDEFTATGFFMHRNAPPSRIDGGRDL